MNDEKHKSDAEVVEMLLEYADTAGKPLILMDSLNAMSFYVSGSGVECHPELVPKGTKIDIFGELTDPETGDIIGDQASTKVLSVVKSDDLTWDMLVIEGDNAIYAGLGIDRRMELIKTMDELELGGR